MPESARPAGAGGPLELRLWVPAAGGELRAIASELAQRIAEDLGTAAPEAQSIAASVERLAAEVCGGEPRQDVSITFDFRQVDRELVVEAHCGSAASAVRLALSS